MKISGKKLWLGIALLCLTFYCVSKMNIWMKKQALLSSDTLEIIQEEEKLLVEMGPLFSEEAPIFYKEALVDVKLMEWVEDYQLVLYQGEKEKLQIILYTMDKDHIFLPQIREKGEVLYTLGNRYVLAKVKAEKKLFGKHIFIHLHQDFYDWLLDKLEEMK